MIYNIIKFVLLQAFIIGSTETLISDNMNFQQEEYSKYVKLKLKNKEQKVSGIDFEENIKYLGKLKLKNKKEYFVLTSFKTIQAAIVKHGQAKIIFLDENQKKLREYIIDLQEHLPYKINADMLFFHFKNDENKNVTIFTKIDDDLPELLCIGNYDCYPFQE